MFKQNCLVLRMSYNCASQIGLRFLPQKRAQSRRYEVQVTNLRKTFNKAGETDIMKNSPESSGEEM